MESVAYKDLYTEFKHIVNGFDLEELFQVQWIGKNTFLKTLEIFSNDGYSLYYLIEINNCDILYCHSEMIVDFVERQIKHYGEFNFKVEYLRDISEISDIDVYSIMHCAGIRESDCRNQSIYLIDKNCVSDDPASGIPLDSYNALKSSMATYTINILLNNRVVETILDKLCERLGLELTSFERGIVIAGCDNQFKNIPAVVNKLLRLKDKDISPKDFNHLIEILENVNNEC